jgi:hypothetical protein
MPTQNEWSWTNLSSVLYVEQPIGTGFSQGQPTAKVRGFPNYAYLYDVVFNVDAMVERRRCCGAICRISAAVLSNFQGT